MIINALILQVSIRITHIYHFACRFVFVQLVLRLNFRMGRSINQIDEFCLKCVLIYFGHFINFFAFDIFYPLFDFNYLCLLIKTIIFDMHELLPILLFVIKTILVKAFSLIVLILSSGALDEFLAILHVLGPKILIILLCVLSGHSLIEF